MRMNYRSKLISCLLILLLISVLALPVIAAPNLPGQARAAHLQLPSQFTGETAYDHIYNLTVEIGPRVAATPEEAEAAEYVFAQFEAMGYEPYYQPFSYVRFGEEYESQNVIAIKPGRSSKTIILGAHYDSVPGAPGASDNASGVGVMLETASLLKDYRTHATIIYIAFGAEEVGLRGSRHYVSEMSEQEINNTVAMINLDMVAGYGDYLYVYAGLDGPTWVRDMALDIGLSQGISIRSTFGLYFDGFTGDWSDHAPFRWAGIPVAYFEHWNWHDGPDDGWGIQNEELGFIYHSPADTIDKVNVEKMSHVGKIVAPLVYELAKTPLPNMDSEGVGKNSAKYKAVGALQRVP